MTDNKPLVSIGMPVYNGGRFVRQVLDSLLTQDYENGKLTISDNASPDIAQQICEAYVARNLGVRYTSNGHNMSPGANCNRLPRLVTGKCLGRTAHHDDYSNSPFSSSALRRLSNA